MERIWLPIVVHSLPLMTPMFLTDRMVKNRSLSARSFQFLFILDGSAGEVSSMARRLYGVISGPREQINWLCTVEEQKTNKKKEKKNCWKGKTQNAARSIK